METALSLEVLTTWFLYFILYSVLGWAVETIYCSLLQGKLAERGFLTGPYCPIYGFGAVFVLIILTPLTSNPLAIFLVGMVITSALEYFASFAMEKIFHMRWWDYSNHHFNIKGRICLLNSTLFGILCLILTLVIHPFIVEVMAKIPFNWLYIIAGVLLVFFGADCIYSTRATLKLSNHLAKIEELQQKVKDELAEIKDNLEDLKDEQEDKFKEWLEDRSDDITDIKEATERWQTELREKRDDYKAKLEAGLESLKKPANYQERRILRSFPNLAHTNNRMDNLLREIKEVITGKRR